MFHLDITYSMFICYIHIRFAKKQLPIYDRTRISSGCALAVSVRDPATCGVACVFSVLYFIIIIILIICHKIIYFNYMKFIAYMRAALSALSMYIYVRFVMMQYGDLLMRDVVVDGR